MTAPRDMYGCELWRGRRTRDGYGLDGAQLAHHAAWERERGPIPDGKELDHVCRRRLCVRVEHLEPVSRRENELRKSWRHRVRRNKCACGADLRARGIRTPEGGILCRRCQV